LYSSNGSDGTGRIQDLQGIELTFGDFPQDGVVLFFDDLFYLFLEVRTVEKRSVKSFPGG
jgi:hypothetical protein